MREDEISRPPAAGGYAYFIAIEQDRVRLIPRAQREGDAAQGLTSEGVVCAQTQTFVERLALAVEAVVKGQGRE